MPVHTNPLKTCPHCLLLLITLPPLPLPPSPTPPGAYEVPEWKQKALGKAPTFGVKDARPILEQRQSLPVYGLKKQLVQAVIDNQVGEGLRERRLFGLSDGAVLLRQQLVTSRCVCGCLGAQVWRSCTPVIPCPRFCCLPP